MATRMLLNNGHQRIGYLASSHRIEDDTMRKEGWLTALKEQGIVAAESWVGTGSPDMQGGESAMVELLGRNLQLTAVFAYNDNMAAGALTALKDNGIAIPLHLSIIGFDDIPIARYTDPQLTTVRYPIASMAKWRRSLRYRGCRHVRPRRRIALCRRWCVAIQWRYGRMRHRSLTHNVARCNRFQYVSKFTVY